MPYGVYIYTANGVAARLIWLSSFGLVYSLWKWRIVSYLSSRALTHVLLFSLSLYVGALAVRSPPPSPRNQDLLLSSCATVFIEGKKRSLGWISIHHFERSSNEKMQCYCNLACIHSSSSFSKRLLCHYGDSSPPTQRITLISHRLFFLFCLRHLQQRHARRFSSKI